MRQQTLEPIVAQIYENAKGILTVQDSAGNTYENRSDGLFKQDAKAGSSFVKLCDAFELVAHTRTVEVTIGGFGLNSMMPMARRMIWLCLASF